MVFRCFISWWCFLTLNTTKHNLVDLKYQKQNLINSFNNISSADYTKFELPVFKIFNEKEFIENNIELKKAKLILKKKLFFIWQWQNIYQV